LVNEYLSPVFTGVSDASEKFIAGIVDTGD
jgi:hypothetical protein